MNVALLCKSDTNGGAAIVTRRLAEALRSRGCDVSLVTIGRLGPMFRLLSRFTFLAERLVVFLHLPSALRKNLWKLDVGRFGLPLWRLKEVREADVVVLNWFNHGMLSLRGLLKLTGMGKKVIWVMHDMWPMTGICHHAMDCNHFISHCGRCPLLGSDTENDLSSQVFNRKSALYSSSSITFVAVSHWLAAEARKSALLRDQRVEVIPNPFDPLPAEAAESGARPRRILFAAASLDNWIKGLDCFRSAVNLLPSLGVNDAEIVLLGAVKDRHSLEGFSLPVRYLGEVHGEEALAGVFTECDVVVNCSHFENLPGTLVEGQAYGAVPVAFDRGGQRDIIDHLSTGYLAPWSPDPDERALAIARGIAWALANRPGIIRAMRSSVENRFSYKAVADRYKDLC